MDELISVVIPVYNSEKFLNTCLESVCNNSYQNLDIILVDDGSTDQSGKICDYFAFNDNRIRVFHKSNSGVSEARNFGISQARGKYLTFIDSDDYIEPEYFSELLNDLLLKKSDLSICPVVFSEKEQVRWECLSDFEINLKQLNKKGKKYFWELNRKYLLYGPCNKMFIMDYILRDQIRFPTDTSYGEDLLFVFQYLRYCTSISYINSTCYFYNRDNESSLSHRYRKDLFENGLRLNQCIRDFCVSNDLFTDKMKQYWAERVFDDAYNSLFDMWNPLCSLKFYEKVKRVKMIMAHSDVRKAIQYADTSNYSKFYVIIIKKKMAFIFTMVRILSDIKGNK